MHATQPTQQTQRKNRPCFYPCVLVACVGCGTKYSAWMEISLKPRLHAREKCRRRFHCQSRKTSRYLKLVLKTKCLIAHLFMHMFCESEGVEFEYVPLKTSRVISGRIISKQLLALVVVTGLVFKTNVRC